MVGGFAPPALVKPRLRGVSHQWAFLVAVALGTTLILLAEGARARAGASVYAAGVCGLFGVSALYHRRAWSPAAARWMRRADHSMIFCFIAASYTPFALLVLDGTLALVLLVVVWAGAVAGVVLKLVWLDAPDWLAATLYVWACWPSAASSTRSAPSSTLANDRTPSPRSSGITSCSTCSSSRPPRCTSRSSPASSPDPPPRRAAPPVQRSARA